MNDNQGFAFEERLRIARDVLAKLPAGKLSASLSFEGFDLEAWGGGSIFSSATRQRLVEVAEILAYIEPWAGSMNEAWDWYCEYEIAALGGETSDELVSKGRCCDVILYVSHIGKGGWS